MYHLLATLRIWPTYQRQHMSLELQLQTTSDISLTNKDQNCSSQIRKTGFVRSTGEFYPPPDLKHNSTTTDWFYAFKLDSVLAIHNDVSDVTLGDVPEQSWHLRGFFLEEGQDTSNLLHEHINVPNISFEYLSMSNCKAFSVENWQVLSLMKGLSYLKSLYYITSFARFGIPRISDQRSTFNL